jgi:hypothetical protein
VCLSVSLFGIILNTFVFVTFIKYSNTCIVKATTRELSFVMLIGFYFCYLITIPLVLKPSAFTCYLTRIIPGLSLSFVYGALFTKTNRIVRVLARRKKFLFTEKPRFMTIPAQILITFLLILVECLIILVCFLNEPEITEVIYPQRNIAFLQCFSSIKSVVGPLGYNMFLILLCTIYSIKTRNLPENFNEAKFIGLSMYTTCVIWLAFIPLYFTSDYKVITLSLSTSFSATVLIMFLFLPKVYIILFKPEKNTRSSFVTNKEIRCHYGNNFRTTQKYPLNKKSKYLDLDDLRLKRIPSNSNQSNNNKRLAGGVGTETISTPNSFKRNGYFKNFQLTFNQIFVNDKTSTSSYDTFMSNFYRVNNRSCQTSLNLIDIGIDKKQDLSNQDKIIEIKRSYSLSFETQKTVFKRKKSSIDLF